jgi:hypothetical protein
MIAADDSRADEAVAVPRNRSDGAPGLKVPLIATFNAFVEAPINSEKTPSRLVRIPLGRHFGAAAMRKPHG